MKHCKQCESILCDVCKKQKATIKMQNKYNGKILCFCKSCHKELFGSMEDKKQ